MDDKVFNWLILLWKWKTKYIMLLKIHNCITLYVLFYSPTLMPLFFFHGNIFFYWNKFNKRTFLCFEKREIKKYVSLNIEVVLNSCLIVFFIWTAKNEIKVMCYVMMYELHMIKKLYLMILLVAFRVGGFFQMNCRSCYIINIEHFLETVKLKA